MAPHRLVRDELLYELGVRGVAEAGHEPVAAMRCKLAEFMRTEGYEDLIEDPNYNLVVDIELAAVEAKVAQLYAYVNSILLDSALTSVVRRLG